MGQPRSYWRIPRTASSHSFQTSQITLERRFQHGCPKMDIAIFRRRFEKGNLKFLLTFIFWNWLFERCNDSWHMQQSKPCSGAGIYGRKLLKKKMKTQSWIILGRVFNNFKMMWIERVIRFKKFSCLQSYSDQHISFSNYNHKLKNCW